ncbi:hypothetical protein C8Q73DRAFT_176927 [Cubamyces lactineus]|nr:hypothetical protein C8Q73DRAFT_176927 [Cubamyces lactineus]
MARSPVLPIETIEAVIKSLDARVDYRTIASCSLLCHTFLPACRSLIWRDVVIGKGKDSRVIVEVAKLFEILKRSPEIRAYVRSVNFDCGPGRYSVRYIFKLCAWFPSLRSLTLRTLHEDALSQLLDLIDSCPTLEELRLSDIHRRYQWTPDVEHISIDVYPSLNQIVKLTSLNTAARSQNPPHLRVLSIVKGHDIQSAWLREIIAALEGSRHALSLRSFEIQAATPTNWTRHVHPDTILRMPSFTPQLSHLGFTLNQFVGRNQRIDTTHSRALVQQFCSGLRKCRALRSLRLHFDCTFAYSMHVRNQDWSWFTPPHPVPLAEPQFFLSSLADVLSTPGSPPCPDLERLSLVFFNPVDWLSGCGAAFARLAQACVDVARAGPQSGMQRRCPRFANLDIHFMISAIIEPHPRMFSLEEAREQFVKDKESILMPMLAPFEQEGITLDVAVG